MVSLKLLTFKISKYPYRNSIYSEILFQCHLIGWNGCLTVNP